MGIANKIAEFFGYVPVEDHDALIDELEHAEEKYHDLVTDSNGYAAAFQFLNLLGYHTIDVRNIEDRGAGTVTGHFNIQYDLDMLTKAFEGMGFTLTPNEHFDKSDALNPTLIDTTGDEVKVSPPATEVVTEIDDPDPLTVAIPLSQNRVRGTSVIWISRMRSPNAY